MLMLIALTTPSAPLVEAGGPSLDVHVPVDGGNSTTREVTVRGCCTAPMQSISLGGDELGNHSGTNMAWDSGALVMQPVRSFNDDFIGSVLDPTKWVIIRDTGETYVEAGFLWMTAHNMSEPDEAMGLLRSVTDIFPENMDWTAEFMLALNYIDDYESGGGISDDPLQAVGSTMAVVGSNIDAQHPLYVFADGVAVYKSGAGVLNLYTYKLEYSSATGECRLLMDGDLLDTFQLRNAPSHFWFGAASDLFTGPMSLIIDQVNIWTYSGNWLSTSYDFGHFVEVDALKPMWTSTNQSSTNFSVEARVSDDNSSWSEWIHALDVGKTSSLSCRYLQLHVQASLPGIKDEQAKISFGSFDLTYHDPIVSVEARRSGGVWTLATGIESWNVRLDLEEDLNVVEVRATDTSGATNETSINVTVDTTRPVGTMSIISEGLLLNDPNVTLSLNATDKYGVTTIQVSNAPDMSSMSSFPYRTELPWRVEGNDGEVSVYVRFVDFHGLESVISQDSVSIDRLPPSGSLLINDGAFYTSSTSVHLDLEYFDNRDVTTIEISNRPNLSDGITITPPQVRVDPWELESGDNGPRTVYIRLTDVAGNVMFINATIDLYIPKALGNVTIEGGADIIRKSIVNLQILIPYELKTTRGQLSNEVDFEGALWETLTRDKTWILSPGDGHKTVYLRFEDFRGIVSLPVNASITVDTTPPVLQVMLEGGASFTTVSDLTATLVYDDASPPSRMWMADNDRVDLVEAQPFSTTFPWSIQASEGYQYLHVKVEDMAGNTATAIAIIHFSTVRPTLVLRLSGGALSGSETTLDVLTLVTDPYGDVEVQVAFGTDPTDDDPWLPANGTYLVQIPPDTPDGTYEVRGRARNIVGLTSEVMTIQVTLDRTPPTVSIMEPLDGAQISQKEKEVQLRYSVEEPNGLSYVGYRVDGGDWTPISPEKRSAILEGVDFGQHTLELRVIDSADNPSITSVEFDLERPEETLDVESIVVNILVLIVLLLALVYTFKYRLVQGHE